MWRWAWLAGAVASVACGRSALDTDDAESSAHDPSPNGGSGSGGGAGTRQDVPAGRGATGGNRGEGGRGGGASGAGSNGTGGSVASAGAPNMPMCALLAGDCRTPTDVHCEALPACSGEIYRGERWGAFRSTLTDIAAAPDGRIAIAGFYRGQVDFGGKSQPLPATETDDGFLAVYGSDGNALWARPFSGPGPQVILGIAFAPDGDLVAQGATDERPDADVGYMLGKAFVTRLDPRGSPRFTKIFGGEETTPGHIAVDNAGAAVLVGSFSGAFDIDGPRDITKPYVVKLDEQGAVVWARGLASMSPSIFGSGTLDTDSHGNVFIAGQRLVDEYSGYLVKLSQAGAELYREEFVSSGYAFLNGVAVGPDDSFALVGQFTGTLALRDRMFPASSPDKYDAWLAKYSPGGELQWVKTFPGNGVVNGALGHSVAIDRFGNVVMAGMAGSVVVDGAVVAPKPPMLQAAYFAKFRANGDLVWVRSIDAWSGYFARVAIDAQNQIWTGGYFQTRLELNGEVVEAAGNSEAFLLRLRP
jgi:hypothetical protein